MDRFGFVKRRLLLVVPLILGVTLVTRWDSDPIYPESKVRPKLWRTWLTDIFLNPHG